MMKHRYLLAIFILICSVGSSSQETPQDEAKAEIAIRWSTVDVASPNLITIKSISDLINPKGTPGKEDLYMVSYYEIERPKNVPENAIVIARKRVKNNKKYELMIKYRSALEMKDYYKKWECPLDGNVVKKPKYEVDISVGKDGVIKRLHSISCEIESKSPIDFPKNFNAQELGSPQQMNRVEIGDMKIEELVGKKMLEVSMPVKDSTAAIDSFYKDIAFPLIEKGVVPELENKSSK